MIFLIRLILILIFCQSSLAEYRVFTLHITNTKSRVVRLVDTTLDPLQYTSVYTLQNNEQISYIETWKCNGRTDFFKAHCANPRLQDQEPAIVSHQSPEKLN